MCQATGKLFTDYARLTNTKAFLTALINRYGNSHIGTSSIVRGGDPGEQGTWVHPDIAVQHGPLVLAGVRRPGPRWVREWANGGPMPNCGCPTIYVGTWRTITNVPAGHFSILVEMTTLLIGPDGADGIHAAGEAAARHFPGQMFLPWLRDEWGIDTETLPRNRHDFEDGRVVYPKAYLTTCWPSPAPFLGVWLAAQVAGLLRGT